MATAVDRAAINILPADHRHLDGMMAVMHAAFDPFYGEAWSAAQVAATLELPGCWGRIAVVAGLVAGFSLCRAAGPEVELLLVAVLPAQRRRGVAARLLVRAQEDALARGAGEIFLEVREDNHAARHLYDNHAFKQVGERPNYYAVKDGTRRGAVTMRFDLSTLV